MGQVRSRLAFSHLAIRLRAASGGVQGLPEPSQGNAPNGQGVQGLGQLREMLHGSALGQFFVDSGALPRGVHRGFEPVESGQGVGQPFENGGVFGAEAFGVHGRQRPVANGREFVRLDDGGLVELQLSGQSRSPGQPGQADQVLGLGFEGLAFGRVQQRPHGADVASIQGLFRHGRCLFRRRFGRQLLQTPFQLGVRFVVGVQEVVQGILGDGFLWLVVVYKRPDQVFRQAGPTPGLNRSPGEVLRRYGVDQQRVGNRSGRGDFGEHAQSEQEGGELQEASAPGVQDL